MPLSSESSVSNTFPDICIGQQILRIDHPISISKEWLIELEWLAKKYSAGVLYPFCQLRKN